MILPSRKKHRTTPQNTHHKAKVPSDSPSSLLSFAYRCRTGVAFLLVASVVSSILLSSTFADDPLDKLRKRSPTKRWTQLRKEIQQGRKEHRSPQINTEFLTDRQKRKIERMGLRIDRRNDRHENQKNKRQEIQTPVVQTPVIIQSRPRSPVQTSPVQSQPSRTIPQIKVALQPLPKAISKVAPKTHLEKKVDLFEPPVFQVPAKIASIPKHPTTLNKNQVESAVIIRSFKVPKEAARITNPSQRVEPVIEKATPAIVEDPFQPIVRETRVSKPTLHFSKSRSTLLQWKAVDSKVHSKKEGRHVPEVVQDVFQSPIIIPQKRLKPRIESSSNKIEIVPSPLPLRSRSGEAVYPLFQFPEEAEDNHQSNLWIHPSFIEQVVFEVESIDGENLPPIPKLLVPPRPTGGNEKETPIGTRIEFTPISEISPFDDYEPNLETRNTSPMLNLRSRPTGKADDELKYAFPEEAVFTKENYTGRFFVASSFRWEASNISYHPLYFQDVQLERYGHDHHELIQPIYSIGKFSGQLLGLPYQWVLHNPDEDVYPLGYYQPGDCVPRLRHKIPLNGEAALVTAGVYTGLFFLIP